MEALMSSPTAHIDDRSIAIRTRKSSSFIGLANQMVAAAREGLTSMHTYEDLRAHGASHADAAKKACAFNS
jgi:hypothetical protein